MADDVKKMCSEATTRVVGRDEFQTRTQTGKCNRPAMAGKDVCSFHANLRAKQTSRAEHAARTRAATEHVRGQHEPGSLRGRCPRCGD